MSFNRHALYISNIKKRLGNVEAEIIEFTLKNSVVKFSETVSKLHEQTRCNTRNSYF